VAPTASSDEIRAAYRRLARELHPDRSSGSAEQMAAVNASWQVLRDPARRAVYDASLRPSAPASAPPRPAPGRVDPDDLDDEPADDGHDLVRVARWGTPALWLLVLGLLAAIFVFTAYAASRGGAGLDPEPPATDGVLELSDCVAAVNERGRVVVVEVDCSQPHVGTVDGLVPFDQACPASTLEYPAFAQVAKVCVRT
jgi:molecular chaperone DnaJ